MQTSSPPPPPSSPTPPAPGSGDPSGSHPDLERLSAWLEGDLSPQEAETVQAHVGQCPVCQAEVESFSLLFQQVRSLPELTAPPAFVSNVMTQIEKEEARGFFGWLRQLSTWNRRLIQIAVPMTVALLAFFMIRQPEQANLQIPSLERLKSPAEGAADGGMMAPPGSEEVAGAAPMEQEPPAARDNLAQPAAMPAPPAQGGQLEAGSVPASALGETGPAEAEAAADAPTAPGMRGPAVAHSRSATEFAPAPGADKEMFNRLESQLEAPSTGAKAKDIVRGDEAQSFPSRESAVATTTKPAPVATGRTADRGELAGNTLGGLTTGGKGMGGGGYGGGGFGQSSGLGAAGAGSYGSGSSIASGGSGVARRASSFGAVATDDADEERSEAKPRPAAEPANAPSSLDTSLSKSKADAMPADEVKRPQSMDYRDRAKKEPAPAPSAPVSAVLKEDAPQKELAASAAPAGAASAGAASAGAVATSAVVSRSPGVNKVTTAAAPKAAATAAAAPRTQSIAQSLDQIAEERKAEEKAAEKKATDEKATIVSTELAEADASRLVDGLSKPPDAIVVLAEAANIDAQVKALVKKVGGQVSSPVYLPNGRRRLVVQLPAGKYPSLIETLKKSMTLGATPAPARKEDQRIWIEIVPNQ